MTLMIEDIIFLQKVCVEKTGNVNYRRNNYTGVEIKQKPQSGRKKVYKTNTCRRGTQRRL